MLQSAPPMTLLTRMTRLTRNKFMKTAIKYLLKKEKTEEYNKLMDALNLIDEQAEDESGNGYAEKKQRAKAYKLVADFISKHTE